MRNPESIIRVADPASGLLAIIVIDSTEPSPALGGARMQTYPDLAAAELDARRLSRGMTLKNAIAGLPFGGGKAAIIGDPQTDRTEARLEAFGRSVEELRGRYITSADMNIHDEHLRIIARTTKYVAGFDRDGETGKNPSPWTALGVFEGIKAAAKHRWDSERLEGARVAIQGVGDVGMPLAEHLHSAGAQLIVADKVSDRVNYAIRKFAADALPVDEILAAECDILAPCAMGAILNRDTIPSIRAAIVAGCANNQLCEDDDAGRLLARGILYAPDYVINAGGVIRVAGEIKNWPAEEIRQRTLAIPATLRRIFRQAQADNCPTAVAADRLAEELIALRNRHAAE